MGLRFPGTTSVPDYREDSFGETDKSKRPCLHVGSRKVGGVLGKALIQYARRPTETSVNPWVYVRSHCDLVDRIEADTTHPSSHV